MSGLVPTFKVAVAFGHLKLIFIVWPNQLDPHALQGNTKLSAFELDKNLVTSCVLYCGVTLVCSMLCDWALKKAKEHFNGERKTH